MTEQEAQETVDRLRDIGVCAVGVRSSTFGFKVWMLDLRCCLLDMEEVERYLGQR